MKVYISADLEGVSGVVAGDQTGSSGSDYGRARKLMTGEVNAAAEAAFEAGAERVIINDAHGGMRNILIEELTPGAELITGTPKRLGMVEGIDRPGLDACMFVGYHARAGTHGVLNHTISGGVVSRISLNGRELGETGLNAALAGHFGVPLVLLTGDTDVCRQAEELVPGMVTVPVKEATGRYSALCHTPEKARDMIKQGVREALALAGEGSLEPFVVQGPVEVALTTNDTAMADLADLLPGSRRVNDLEVAYEGDDVLCAGHALRAMIYLASCARR